MTAKLLSLGSGFYYWHKHIYNIRSKQKNISNKFIYSSDIFLFKILEEDLDINFYSSFKTYYISEDFEKEKNLAFNHISFKPYYVSCDLGEYYKQYCFFPLGGIELDLIKEYIPNIHLIYKNDFKIREKITHLSAFKELPTLSSIEGKTKKIAGRKTIML